MEKTFQVYVFLVLLGNFNKAIKIFLVRNVQRYLWLQISSILLISRPAQTLRYFVDISRTFLRSFDKTYSQGLRKSLLMRNTFSNLERSFEKFSDFLNDNFEVFFV